MVNITAHGIVTNNGNVIQGTFYQPGSAPQATVLIVPAMGVDQRFYAPLATWLADRGYLTATFDYVGIGRSRGEKLAQLRVDILDWARFDCDAMVSQLQSMAPGKDVAMVCCRSRSSPVSATTAR